ncbi:hypothetical protein [Paenibacillus doosanensis]|uniref:hypothetical protein n=1 Tax=Paenibacillus doosanensis TaxID=1229154 RepID=UPI00218045F1|nr:hypothetical protein [Paenibacillus doosanensis]
MRNLAALCLIISLLLACAAACSRDSDPGSQTAKRYVQSQGYEVTKVRGLVEKYTLDRAKLYGETSTLPYRQSWGVQTARPEDYFGQDILIYAFTVKGHPLENIYRVNTNVYIMLSGGKVIGGYSFPDATGLAGAVYSLDGKTLEEVTGLSFREWQDQWKRKYGDGS